MRRLGGLSWSVSATTRSATSGPSGGIARGPRLVAQRPSKRSSAKRSLPGPDAGLGLAGPPHDFDVADTIGDEQHDLGTPDVLLRTVAVADPGSQPHMIRRRDGERYSCAHAPGAHAHRQKRIPPRLLMSGGNHYVPSATLSACSGRAISEL